MTTVCGGRRGRHCSGRGRQGNQEDRSPPSSAVGKRAIPPQCTHDTYCSQGSTKNLRLHVMQREVRQCCLDDLHPRMCLDIEVHRLPLLLIPPENLHTFSEERARRSKPHTGPTGNETDVTCASAHAAACEMPLTCTIFVLK